MELFRMRKHALVSLIFMGTLIAVLASVGTVHATSVKLVKDHHPPSTFTDPSGTVDGYLVGQTVTWYIHLNVTSSKAPFPWFSISNLIIIDTLPNLGAGSPTALFVTYVSGSQNSSSAQGAAAFTDFGNGTLEWNFGAGPFITGVLAPPPFRSTTEFYTAAVTFNTTIDGNVTDNAFLTNAGVATYTETGSGVHSAPSISDTIWVPRPVLNIVKVNPAKVDNGSSFNYVLQLSNMGHETATGVVVQDIIPTGVTHTPPATATSGSFIKDTSTNVTWTGTLFNVTSPGNTVNITIPVTANTALPSAFNSASFIAYPSDTAFTNRSANCTTGVIHPAISLTKTPSASKIENGSSVTYNYNVTNTGDTTLTGVNVTDNQFGTIASGQTLTAGQSMSFTKTTTLTANTTNTATATGVDQTGASVSAIATAFVRVIHPAISLTKTPSTSKVENGSSVSFTFTVTNTGDTSLTVGLVDSVFGTIFSGKVLVAGASNVTIISRVLVANTTNTATATGVDQNSVSVHATATASVQVIHPAISLTKTPSVSKVENGSSVSYTFTVTNTGDTSLTVGLVDSVFGVIFSGKVLVAGASNTTVISEVLTANTTNVATATGIDQNSVSVSATATASVQVIHPAISLTKTPSVSKVENGSSVSYTFTVTNTGDTSLTVGLVDSVFGTIFSGKVLVAGASNVTIISRVLVANTTNTATATGVDQTGASVSANATAFVQIISPAISLTKTASPSSPQLAPANFTYTYVVTNIGDVALSGVTVYDQTFNQLILGPVPLSVGQSATGTYGPVTFTNATVFTNYANATGTDQTGATVEAFAQATVMTLGPLNLDAEPPGFFLTTALARQWNTFFNASFDLGKPLSTIWDELYPSFGATYNVTKWFDANNDGFLDPGDFVGMQVGASQGGSLYWWHVDNVTVTMKVALWPSKDVMFYLELKDGWPKYAQTRVIPNGTEWYEVYPQYGPQYRIVKWKDNCDSMLDYCDNVTLLDEDTGKLADYHIELAKTDLIVSPRTTQIIVGSTKDFIGKGYPQVIPVTIENYEPDTTNFTVDAYYNGIHHIGTQTLILNPLDSGNAIINWTDVENWQKGTYNYDITLNVYANGTLFYSTIFPTTFKITPVGDVDGSGIVDMKDIAIVAKAFGTTLNDPIYDPNADVNCNCVVDMRDLAIVARNYGNTDP